MVEAVEPSRAKRSAVYQGPAADARLALMGLTSTQLLAAVSRGDEKRKECGPLHPKTFPGQVMWAETTEALRRQLIPTRRGWTPGSLDNYETVYSRETGIGIVVAGGDAFTGVDGFQSPSFNRRKGPLTQLRLQRNQALRLQPSFEGMEEDEAVENAVQTWFLLCNARERKLFVELSLPTIASADGKPSVWPERILLEPLDSAEGVTPVIVDGPSGAGELPNVVVERRQ